jgi:hypothetical protein
MDLSKRASNAFDCFWFVMVCLCRYVGVGRDTPSRVPSRAKVPAVVPNPDSVETINPTDVLESWHKPLACQGLAVWLIALPGPHERGYR